MIAIIVCIACCAAIACVSLVQACRAGYDEDGFNGGVAVLVLLLAVGALIGAGYVVDGYRDVPGLVERP